MTTRFIAQIFIFVLLAVSFVACTDPDPNPTNQTCYVKKAMWGGDSSILFSYNTANKLTEQRHMKGNTEIAKYTYTYNTQGNVSKMTSSLNSTTTLFAPISHEYIYNATNQLVEVKRVFSDGIIMNNKFILDNLGRITEDNQVGVPSWWSYKTAYTYNMTGNATNSTRTYPNGVTLGTEIYQFDDKKNLYKDFPMYSLRDFFSPLLLTINVNNFKHAKIAYTYNLQGYPVTQTYTTSYISPITYEYDCK